MGGVALQRGQTINLPAKQSVLDFFEENVFEENYAGVSGLTPGV